MRRLLLCALLLGAVGVPLAADEPGTEIDQQVWKVIAETVVNDDIVRMGSVYLKDAVLVSPKGTRPISEALAGWGRDMVTAKAKGNRATVEFRFTMRQDGPTTAFETGMFKYTVIEKSGERKSSYIPFEQLMAKVNGKWSILMERQLAAGTEEDWKRLGK